MAPDERYDVDFARTARRHLAEELPEAVAAAAFTFIVEVLRERPRQVGKPLLSPQDGQWSARRGEYRVLYRIDEQRRTVTVLAVRHRRDAYRG